MISIEDLKFAYPSTPNQAVVDMPIWQVNKGEHVFVVGDSGSGKSTLLAMLSGLIRPDSGHISVDEVALHTLSNKRRDHFRATRIGYVAQNFNLVPYLSAIENVQLAYYFASNKASASDAQMIENLLRGVNIERLHWNKPVNQLSIGQQQRVAIARAIVNKPKLLIADEPTSSLDQRNRDTFLDMLMQTSNENNMTLVFVSHDLSLSDHFDRTDSMSQINQAGR